MKANELRKLKKEELLKKVDELKMELMRLRFKNKIERLKNPNVIRRTKKDIARVLTIIREKELRGEE